MKAPTACPDCLRHGKLLAHLAPYIERAACGKSSKELLELLRCTDVELAERVAPRAASTALGSAKALSDEALRAEVEAACCWSVCPHVLEYPSALFDLTGDRPQALYGIGQLDVLGRFSDPEQMAVAIVGSRRASHYGREVALSLGRDLADAGAIVVSGLGFGIDSCAHRGALETGTTVAVLGCGADQAYPAANRSLWRRIVERGVVLSELPPGMGGWRWTFPMRNRIVAGLAGMTVVVEAAERSASLFTAGQALANLREVGAVPGQVSSRLSAGPNSLIVQREALPVREAGDVLAAMQRSDWRPRDGGWTAPRGGAQ